jgi:hypothetical protein
MTYKLPPLPERYSAHRDEITGHVFCDLFTEGQMQAYGQQCRDAALEEAAKVCDAAVKYYHPHFPESSGAALHLGTTIRSLK